MKMAEDLELEFLPMEKPEFARNPLPYFAAAREKHPWLATCNFGYVVHQYDAMKDLLIQDDKMDTALDTIVMLMGAQDTPWGRLTANTINAQSGERHKQMRDLLMPLFSPRQANQNRLLMQEVITKLLDDSVPKGAFDFEEVVGYFPIGVLCSMLGAPAEELPRIRSSLEILGRGLSLDPGILSELQVGAQEIDRFGQELVAERRAGKRPEKGGELLDVLIEAADNGGLTERELYDLLIFLFVGGYDTSKNILTLIMYEMINYPEYYRRCAEDISFCEKVAEEALRYQSVANYPRITTEVVTYRDVIFPERTMLFFPVSMSGRDPSAFSDADTFDPERRHGNRHIAFGRGMHICLGQFIARAQIVEGLHLIAQRVKNPRLAGDVAWRPFLGIWGLEGLPIEFDPA
ncbi:cytochrome P450 [Emcibacter nanhaiensis]|uniref:Cytochrome P450 n=1 Tax=Emcibacter nanhaiensis TaxID=1505037 RepID=A0A501PTD4_9PROT|nr:cytochrome P450 [Emcibacter nanhaiensis]TPD63234.1 cytochrome P450 [Emcibacter nanhaiensis]